MKYTFQLQPLTQAAFAPFGDVIECQGRDFFPINQNFTERYHRLGMVQNQDSETTAISIFRQIQAYNLPIRLTLLERHPLASQAFIPMQGQSFIVVVAPALDDRTPDWQNLKAFITNGLQGVNYHQGTWHHPLITLTVPSHFAVIDRAGKEKNCDIFQLPEDVLVME